MACKKGRGVSPFPRFVFLGHNLRLLAENRVPISHFTFFRIQKSDCCTAKLCPYFRILRFSDIKGDYPTAKSCPFFAFCGFRTQKVTTLQQNRVPFPHFRFSRTQKVTTLQQNRVPFSHFAVFGHNRYHFTANRPKITLANQNSLSEPYRTSINRT